MTWKTQAAALDASLPAGSAKLMLNLLLFGADLLGRGSGLAVEGRTSPQRSLVVEVKGEALRDDLGDQTSSGADLTPRSVQPVFIAKLAEALGARAAIEHRGIGTAILKVDF